MAAVSKEEYLKRYLSGASQDEKKKKKKKVRREGEAKPAVVVPRMRIVDTDVDVPSALHQEPTVYTVGDGEETADIEELPQVAAVEDHREMNVQLEEEFKKSGKWRTFTGEDIARKNLINEVIKIEQTNLKDEPMDEEELAELKKAQKKAKKAAKTGVKVEVKEEPASPDASPPRRRHDSDASPRRRHDSDASPSRRRHDSDASPPRRRHDSSSDEAPRKRHDSDSDASPPRRRADSDSDASPPRRPKAEPDSDASPPRRPKAEEDSDASPPRRNRGGSDSDLSPPREGLGMGRGVKMTLDGKKAGLQNARDLKDELTAIRAKERDKMEQLPDEVSGRHAETKVRGRLAEKERKLKEEKERKEVPEEVKEKFKAWSKGVAQVKAADDRLESDLHEMAKPLTRGVDDEDRESHLKDVEHADDPMLMYMRKKKAKLRGRQKRLPQYQGPQPAPNRFGILPGYRWDGVDRGNGFEKKLMTQGAAKNARMEESYKWSTEDM